MEKGRTEQQSQSSGYSLNHCEPHQVQPTKADQNGENTQQYAGAITHDDFAYSGVVPGEARK